MTEVDDVKGYGMRGLCLLRRGEGKDQRKVVHLIESICRSHKLTIRSSYGAEMLAAAHGIDEAYPTLITLREIKHGMLSPEKLKAMREEGESGVLGNDEPSLTVTLATDAESVYKSLSSRDMKVPTEKTLLGHVSWLRALLSWSLFVKVEIPPPLPPWGFERIWNPFLNLF